MRPDEEYAARKLREFLETQGAHCAYEAGGKSPDYVFQVNGARWAVEVTRLHDYVGAGAVRSARWVEAGLKKIFDDIERETASTRKRRYTIALTGPISPQDVPGIKRQAINYVSQDHSEQFVCGGNKECMIFPEEGPGSNLDLLVFVGGCSRLPESTDIHADIQATIDDAVSRILEKKVPRLQSLREFDKRVLCILSQYFFADDGNVRSSLSAHKDQLRNIVTIFLVSGNSVADVSP